MDIRNMTCADLMKLVESRLKTYAYLPKVEERVRYFLELMGVGHAPVEVHSKRVPFLAERVAVKIGLDPSFGFIVAILHDIGKLMCRGELFSGEEIDEMEFARVRRHAEAGYFQLREVDLEIALAVGIIHSRGKGEYGLTENDIPNHFSRETIAKIVGVASLVSVCDFVDSSLTRQTHLREEAGSGKRLSDKLLAKFPRHGELVEAVVGEATVFYEVDLNQI